MLGKLSLTLLASTIASLAFAAEAAETQAITYAIENPLRPGAKAPHCPSQPEPIDGCTFHSVAGDTYAAKLPVKPGETWVASTPDSATITLRPLSASQTLEGKVYQVIDVVPNPAVNADTTVTFDRLTGQPGSLKVIERRRISVMIHPA